MEEKKNIKISLSTFFLIIAIIVIIIMLGYIYVIKNKENNNEQITNTNEVEKSYSKVENVLNNTKSSEEIKGNNSVQDETKSITEVNANNTQATRYSNFINSLIKQRNNTNGIWLKDEGNTVMTYIKSDGKAYLTLTGDLANKYGANYKLYDDIVMCKNVFYNQGGVEWFVYVHENGTVSRVMITSDSIEKKEYSNVKNIVNISTIGEEENSPVDTTCPVCIDIDGNIFKLE